jgi:hypothetical protein
MLEWKSKSVVSWSFNRLDVQAIASRGAVKRQLSNFKYQVEWKENEANFVDYSESFSGSVKESESFSLVRKKE